MAPELLLPEEFGLDGRVSKQADIYAFGMVVYEVLTGRIPFAGEGRGFAEIVLRVMKGRRPSKPENAEGIGFGKGTWKLVERCWEEDRERRPTVDDVSKHFKRVARTSEVVPPGSATLARVVEVEHPTTPEPDSFSGNFGKCLNQVHGCQFESHFVQSRQSNYSTPFFKQAQASFSRSSLSQMLWLGTASSSPQFLCPVLDLFARSLRYSTVSAHTSRAENRCESVPVCLHSHPPIHEGFYVYAPCPSTPPSYSR